MVHHIPFDEMERFMVDVFKGIGVPEEDAKVCGDVLITADRRGIDSHGIGRLKPIYYDRIIHQKIQHPVTEFEVVHDHLSTAVVDGHHGMGMVIAKRSMQMAIDKAKKHGMGASFIAKPLLEFAGNGLHMHISVVDARGKNIFAATSKAHARLYHAIGGLLETMPSAMSFWASGFYFSA